MVLRYAASLLAFASLAAPAFSEGVRRAKSPFELEGIVVGSACLEDRSHASLLAMRSQRGILFYLDNGRSGEIDTIITLSADMRIYERSAPRRSFERVFSHDRLFEDADRAYALVRERFEHAPSFMLDTCDPYRFFFPDSSKKVFEHR